MTKILNKIFFNLKNIILVLLIPIVYFIIAFMFERIGKEMFGKDLLEFVGVLFPFALLIILILINIIFKQSEVKDNLYYNITSFLCMIVICIFCYRATMDSNMYFLNKYEHHINYNYFADQVAPIKIMLYGLSISNILLMISGALKVDNYEEQEKIHNNQNVYQNQIKDVNGKKNNNQNRNYKKYNNKKVNKNK